MSDTYGIDGHKLAYHPERLAQWFRARDDWDLAKKVYPIYLEVSPTNRCNHACSFCAMDYLPSEPASLSTDVMNERFVEMAQNGVKSVMFGGEGEPLLHRDCGSLVKGARQSGIDTALTTNGVMLNERFCEKALADLSWIKVSLNAGTPETYAAVHGCRPEDFHTVVDNLKRTCSQRAALSSQTTIGAQILLLPENASEIHSLALRCRDEIGLDYLVVKPYSQHGFSKTKRYSAMDYEPYYLMAETLSDLNTDAFSLIFRLHTMKRHGRCKTYDYCHASPFFWAYVMSNGDLYSCSSFLGDRRFCLGNLMEQSFQDVWEGPGRKQNYDMIRHGLSVSECRTNCRMDSINHYLSALIHPGAHDNFI